MEPDYDANREEEAGDGDIPKAIPYHPFFDGHHCVQRKAWMDTVGIAMWLDVQLGPYFAKKRKKCFLVWDNCGPHNVPALAEVLTSWGVTAEPLPPKMTDILQVMDLIVNGPVKAGIRQARITAIFNFFQSWKIARLQHLAAKLDTLPPDFLPPKPTQAQGLLTVFDVFTATFEKPSFQESMRECFKVVGLAPLPDGSFTVYSPTKKGLLLHLMRPVVEREDAVSVGEIAAEVQMTSPPRQGADGPSEQASSDGESEQDTSSEADDV